MTLRLLIVIAVALAIECGIFYWRYHDVVLLAGSRAELVIDPRFPDAARAVLARERVSRRVLERVADVARERRDRDLHVGALQRIVRAVPEEPGARLRLAQALRDAGRLEEAESIYRQELDRAAGEARP